jgi:hypothetical protein
MNGRGILCDQRGAGLVFALAVVLLVAMAAQAALAVLAFELKAAGNTRDASWAFQVAEAGAERAVFELSRDADWTDQAGATALLGQAEDGWAPVCLDPDSRGTCPTPATSVLFPAGEPVGSFQVVWRPRTGPECGPEGCVCVRSTGNAGSAARRVEVVLARAGTGAPVRTVYWREVLGELTTAVCGRG